MNDEPSPFRSAIVALGCAHDATRDAQRLTTTVRLRERISIARGYLDIAELHLDRLETTPCPSPAPRA